MYLMSYSIDLILKIDFEKTVVCVIEIACYFVISKRYLQTFEECVDGDYYPCADPRGFYVMVPFFCGHDALCR